MDTEAINQPLEEFIRQLIKDKQYDYSFQGNTIVIKPATPARNLKLAAIFFPPPITGVVRGPDGQPIAG